VWEELGLEDYLPERNSCPLSFPQHFFNRSLFISPIPPRFQRYGRIMGEIRLLKRVWGKDRNNGLIISFYWAISLRDTTPARPNKEIMAVKKQRSKDWLRRLLDKRSPLLYPLVSQQNKVLASIKKSEAAFIFRRAKGGRV